jgi:hypothetical protein
VNGFTCAEAFEKAEAHRRPPDVLKRSRRDSISSALPTLELCLYHDPGRVRRIHRNAREARRVHALADSFVPMGWLAIQNGICQKVQ